MQVEAGAEPALTTRTRPSEPLRLVRFRPHHFSAEVGVVLFARALASMLESEGEII